MAEDYKSAGFFDILWAMALGIVFSLLFLIPYAIVASAWGSISTMGSAEIDGISFNYDYSTIKIVHYLLIVIGYAILCSCIIGYYYWKKGYKPTIIAALSGLAGAIFPIYYTQFYRAVPIGRYTYYSNNFDLLFIEKFVASSITLFNEGVNFILIGGFGLTIYIILSTLTAYVFVKLCYSMNPGWQRIKLLLPPMFAMILILFVPLLLTYSSLQNGSIDSYPDIVKKQPDLHGISWPLDIERTANDTIVITNNGYVTSSGIDLDAYLNSDKPFLITINWFDDFYLFDEGRYYGVTSDSAVDLGRTPGSNVTLVSPFISEFNGESAINNTTVRVYALDYNGYCINSTKKVL